MHAKVEGLITDSRKRKSERDVRYDAADDQNQETGFCLFKTRSNT